MPQEIAVRHVAGRYPHRPASFRSENILATVSEMSRIYRIRLDDAEHPDAWMELTVEVGSDEIVVGEPLETPEAIAVDGVTTAERLHATGELPVAVGGWS